MTKPKTPDLMILNDETGRWLRRSNGRLTFDSKAKPARWRTMKRAKAIAARINEGRTKENRIARVVSMTHVCAR